MQFMEQTYITISKPQVKQDCDEFFSKYGMTTESAINLYLESILKEQSISVSLEEILDQVMIRAVRNLPEAGRVDEKTGRYILPKDWYNEADNEYVRQS